MSGRFERISADTSLLYTEGSPVIIAASALLKDDLNGKVIAQVKFENISNKKIVALFVDVETYSVTGEELEGVKGFQYLDLNVVRDVQFGSQTPIYLPNNTTRKINIKVKKALFSDETDWVADEGATWSALPSSTQREPFEDAELERQFKMDYGRDYTTAPEKFDDLWYCACGTLNKLEDQECKKCTRNQSVLEGPNLDKLVEDKDARLKEEAEKAEQARIEREENERIRAEKLAVAKKKGKKIALIAAPILCLIIVFLIILNTVIIPNNKYNEAISLINEGNYDAAYALLTEIGDTETIASNKYDRAMSLIDDGDYESAYSLLEEIGDNETILSNKYDRAMKLINSGDYESAYNLLNGLSYKDSKDKLLEITPKYHQVMLLKAEVGSTVFFGTYEQDNNTSNGEEEIEWRGLAKEGNKILVVSKYAIDCQKYNSTRTNTTWEECSIRTWLNETFIDNAFSTEEQSKIVTTTVSADKNPNYSTDPGNTTEDKVFLLSVTEAKKYFTSDKDRKCEFTAYARKQTSGGFWWLRSTGGHQNSAVDVISDGSIDYYGTSVDNELIGCVRPALWIDLES